MDPDEPLSRWWWPVKRLLLLPHHLVVGPLTDEYPPFVLDQGDADPAARVVAAPA